MNEESFTSSGFTTTQAHPGSPDESRSPLQQKAEQTMYSAQSEAERLKNSAYDQGAAAFEQVKAGVQSATQQAQEAGKTFVRNQQEIISRRLGEYAEAARAASEKLRADEGNMLAGPAQTAAHQLERLSTYFRDKQPADLMDDLETFARRRPEVVFGGLFVLGLAATRFLKASRRSLEEREMSRAIVPASGVGASQQMNFGPTSNVGSTSSMPFGPSGTSASGIPSTSTNPVPSSSPATFGTPPVSGASTPTTPSVPSASSTSTSTSDCGCAAFPESSTQSNPMP